MIKLGNSGCDPHGWDLPMLLSHHSHHIATHNLLWTWTFDKHYRWTTAIGPIYYGIEEQSSVVPIQLPFSSEMLY